MSNKSLSEPNAELSGPGTAPNLILKLWLPFSCAYFMSYALRNVNAVLAPDLTHDFSLSASQLGMLTSVFSLTFVMAQLPGGVLIDRYGARRVNAALIMLAAVGCGLFALGDSLAELVVGRALIGAGMAMCLMAAVKIFSQSFSIQRLPVATGLLLAVGGLGGIVAGAPVGWAVLYVSWRVVFLISALMLTAAAVFVFVAVPERRPSGPGESLGSLFRGFGAILANKTFWRLNLMAAAMASAYQSMQSLWIGPWLRDVAGYGRTDTVVMITWLALATTVGFAGLGAIINQLMRRGWQPLLLYKLHSGLFIALFASIVVFRGAATPLWLALFTLGVGGLMLFTIYAQIFPLEWSGRVNTAGNVVGFGSTFAAQWGIGVVLDRYPVVNGHYSPEAYQSAFLVLLAMMLVAYAWLLPMRRPEGFSRTGREAGGE